MESTSAAPSKYYWMRYSNERSTSIKIADRTIKIDNRALFGVRELRNSEFDEVLLTDGTCFKLSIAKSDLLMKRSKEYKGKLPEVKVTPKAKVPKVVAPEKTNVDRLFAAKLKSVGLTLNTVSAIKEVEFKKIMQSLTDDAHRIEFKSWILARLPRTSAKHQKISAFVVAGKKTPTVTVVKRERKAIQSKLTATTQGPIKVRLSEIELPELDDFTDHGVPDEFKRFARVESSGNYLSCVASDQQLKNVSASSADEFNEIVAKYLAPAIDGAKKVIEGAVKHSAAKIRAWAMTHLRQAQQLGHRTDLFEKLINNPEAAARQVANTLLGIRAPSVHKVQEEKKLDAVLDSIIM